MKGSKGNFVIIISLKVNYCDQYLSVAPPSISLSVRQLFLQTTSLLDQWTDFKIILQKCSLGDPLPKLLKSFRSTEQNGNQS